MLIDLTLEPQPKSSKIPPFTHQVPGFPFFDLLSIEEYEELYPKLTDLTIMFHFLENLSHRNMSFDICPSSFVVDRKSMTINESVWQTIVDTYTAWKKASTLDQTIAKSEHQKLECLSLFFGEYADKIETFVTVNIIKRNDLYRFLENYNLNLPDKENYREAEKVYPIQKFFEELKRLGFTRFSTLPTEEAIKTNGVLSKLQQAAEAAAKAISAITTTLAESIGTGNPLTAVTKCLADFEKQNAIIIDCLTKFKSGEYKLN